MHIPSAFREPRIEAMHELMQAHPLGLLISAGAGGPQATPLPFLIFPGEGQYGTLRAHMARANPHWQELQSAGECLVVFQGLQGYITPSWYPSKRETGKVVPTWNYAAVHARGTPVIIDDAQWLGRQLERLTLAQEASRPQAWAVRDAPADYVASLMTSIVGIEIPIRTIEGKWKMSQNRSEADRHGVIDGLHAADDPDRNPAMSDLVAARNRASDGK